MPGAELEVVRADAEDDPAAQVRAGERHAAGAEARLAVLDLASTRFIAGEPMNAATNRFAGWSKSVSGVSHCCRTPPRMTATRWPSVIASTWSWVT